MCVKKENKFSATKHPYIRQKINNMIYNGVRCQTHNPFISLCSGSERKPNPYKSTLRPDGHHCSPFKVATPIMGIISRRPFDMKIVGLQSPSSILRIVVSLFGMRVNSDFPNNSRIYKFANHSISLFILL